MEWFEIPYAPTTCIDAKRLVNPGMDRPELSTCPKSGKTLHIGRFTRPCINYYPNSRGNCYQHKAQTGGPRTQAGLGREATLVVLCVCVCFFVGAGHVNLPVNTGGWISWA